MFIVTLNGIVHSEAADVIRARQIAEEAVAAGGGVARVAEVVGECRAVPTPQWSERDASQAQ